MTVQTVREVMTPHVVTRPSETTLTDAAVAMREEDIGDIVVCNDDELAGLITDRDIVVRAVAERRDPTTTTIGEILTEYVVTVHPDDSVQAAALLMRDNAVRRVVVCGDDKKVVGIVSIGDLAEEIDPESVLGGISRAEPNN
jgi:CBS domain-containing protein